VANKREKTHLHTDFYIRRIHSILGIIPIGIFLCLHLTLNSAAILGVDAWATVINGMREMPFVILAEIGIIAIPIIFHAVYGAYVVYVSDMHFLQYQYVKNWMYILQRVTAIITSIFVVYHVVFVRIMSETTMDVMAAMADVLQTPLGFVLELIGIWSAIYHFTNGIFTFLITWGILHGDRIQKLFSLLTMMLCAALCLLALIIMIRIAMMPI
jgi:succinate dehydrogenase / fumarate reductase cytochrome b subunit